MTTHLLRPCLLLAIACCAATAAAECVPLTELHAKKGDAVCITATVLKVNQSRAGNWFLDFCENYRQCPFSVFVSEKDAAGFGDLHRLQGQEVTIYGRIREYNGKPEIILRDKRQLEGEKLKFLPPEDEPKGIAANQDFDASHHGPHHHPWHGVKASHAKSKKPVSGGSSTASTGAAPPTGGSSSTKN